MKKELFQITKDLAQNKITEQEARTLLLGLVTGSIVANVWCYVFGLPCRNSQAYRKSLLAN